MKNTAFLVALLLLVSCSSNLPEPPALKRNFQTPTSSAEVREFTRQVAGTSGRLHYEIIGISEGGSELASIKVAPARSESPLRVLIFAQQHGNEQSSKEASLLLIHDLAMGKHAHWLDNMEIWIVPQVNPEGSDENQRRNAGGIDLNRDHVVQLAPETRALHKVFRSFMPHITIDIHEYYPFRESWAEFGGYKNFEVQVGIPTNPNVAEELREFGLSRALPHIEKHLNEKGFSFHNYIVGPAPNLGRTRHSTVDFDDGRQSFAILNTLSFIYEGINGRDGFTENLERRTHGQYEALIALLDFSHANAQSIIEKVENTRQELHHAKAGETVAIRMEHFPDSNPLMLPLVSSKTGLDTLVVVENYHPKVKTTLQVQRPRAYLVPQNDTLLMQFLDLHDITYRHEYNTHTASQYFVESIETSTDEELRNRYPDVTTKEIIAEALNETYVWVPINQLHTNFLVSVFEPQSMLGLAQRPGFEYLLQEGTPFPILRVE